MTREAMQRLAARHAELEARRDLAGTLATLVADPAYEFHPVALGFRGGGHVRRYYEELFAKFIPITKSYQLLDEWVNAASAAQEYEVELAVEGRTERHRILGILYASGELLGGERVYASERCIRLMVGDLFDALTPLAPGQPGGRPLRPSSGPT